MIGASAWPCPWGDLLSFLTELGVEVLAESLCDPFLMGLVAAEALALALAPHLCPLCRPCRPCPLCRHCRPCRCHRLYRGPKQWTWREGYN